MHLVQLYNHRYVQDRRQNSSPVNIDRRTQQDRRTSPRLQIDNKIRQDVQFARQLMKTNTTDVFIKSGNSVQNTKQAEKASASIPAFNGLNKLIKSSNEDGSKRGTADAAIGAIGAGIGLSLPLFAGLANPLMLAGLTVVGAASSIVLANKALDLYNSNN